MARKDVIWGFIAIIFQAHAGGNKNETTRIFKDDSGGGRCNDAAGMFISIVTGRWQQEA